MLNHEKHKTTQYNDVISSLQHYTLNNALFSKCITNLDETPYKITVKNIDHFINNNTKNNYFQKCSNLNV